MPVVKRLVEPVHCSRAPIPKGVRNELEAVSVNTLSSVILQLSSLAKHAESIFSELFTEANSIHQRSVSVQQRLEQLAVKVTKLDSAGEEISLQDINMQKAFRLTIRSDQQVLSRETLPEAMKESYGKCEPVPNLNALTPFRHDGREALTLYTDPTYFFELWKQKMNVEVEKRRKKKKRGHRGKKRDEEKKVVKGVKKKEVAKNIPDWEIQGGKQQGSATVISDNTSIESGQLSPTHSVKSGISNKSSSPSMSPRRMSAKRQSVASSVGRPTSAPPPPPPGGVSPSRQAPAAPPPPPPPPGQGGLLPGSAKPVSPPPVPPPSVMVQSPSSPLPSPPSVTPNMPSAVPPPPPPVVGSGPPPPPPPPPPTGMPIPPPPPPTGVPAAGGIIGKVVQSSPRAPAAPVDDSRNDLLNAIRHGMNLRKTQQITKEERKEHIGNDVASILARRIAVEYSDSEDDDSDFTDDGDWSDDE